MPIRHAAQAQARMTMIRRPQRNLRPMIKDLRQIIGADTRTDG